MTEPTDRRTCAECDQPRPEREATFENAAKMDKLQLCHACYYWLQHVGRVDEPESIRVDGCHYRTGPETGPAWPRGMGGRRMQITWLDDSRPPTTSTNIWSQGRIPDQFRDRLPDNARMTTAKPEAPAGTSHDLYANVLETKAAAGGPHRQKCT